MLLRLLAAALVLIVSALAAAPVCAANALGVGAVLPPLSATTVAGKTVDVVSVASGRPVVLVIGESKAAAGGSAAWSHAFYNAYRTHAGVFGIALLDKVPGLVRGFAIGDVKKSAPIAQEPHGSNVLYSTDKTYRPLLPAGDEKIPVVIIADAAGHVKAIEREDYTKQAFEAVRASLP